MKRKNISTNKISVIIIATGAIVALIVLAVFLVYRFTNILPTNKPIKNDKIIANNMSANFLTDESNIILETDGLKSQENILKNLKIEPDSISLNLQKENDNTYYIELSEKIKPGQTITFYYYDIPFEFTMGAFLKIKITSSPYGDAYSTKLSTADKIYFEINDYVNLEDFKKAVTFEPPIEGVFNVWEAPENRIIEFTPKNRLAFEKSYSISINDKFTSENGYAIKDAISADFFVSQESDFDYLSLKKPSLHIIDTSSQINFTSKEVPLIEFYTEKEISNKEDNPFIKIHKFADENEFLDMRNKYFNKIEVMPKNITLPKNLEMISEFLTQPIPVENYDGYYEDNNYYVVFPDMLKEGLYIVQIDYLGDSFYILIQVSDLAVYTLLSDNSLLVWVNDSLTGETVQDAEVEVKGSFNGTGKTDADGKLIMKDTTKQIKFDEDFYNRNTTSYYTVKTKDRTFIDVDSLNPSVQSNNPSTEYYSYIYTDRSIYKTSDEIYIFGMIKSRNNGVEKPKDVSIGFSGEDIPVTLNESGFFKEKIDLKNMRGTIYSYIDLQINNVALNSSYFTILDFVKPEYTIDLSTSKLVYLAFENEIVDLTAELTTFDGTPVANTGLIMRGNGNEVENITDSNGIVKFNIPTEKTSERLTSIFNTNYFDIYTTEEDNEITRETIPVEVFYSNLILQGEAKLENDNIIVDVSTNLIDINGIKEKYDIWNYKSYLGLPIEKVVSAKLIKHFYNKYESGKYFDNISQELKPTYRYEIQEEIVNTFDFTTLGGKFTITDIPKLEKGEYYTLELLSTDDFGSTVEIVVNIGNYIYRNSQVDSNIKRFEFMKTKTESDIKTIGYSDYYHGDAYNKFYEEENLEFNLYLNEEEMVDFKGRILYTTVQTDIKDAKISDANIFNIEYNKDFIPNFSMAGAYFDGERIYAIPSCFLSFDSKSKELEIDIKTDKDSYLPGEKVKAEVNVKNKKTGKVAKDTTILLSVVDEAIFAVADQNIFTASEIYRDVFYPNLDSYVSHKQKSYDGAGEMGGGGGDADVRKDFKNTPYFEILTTNEKGQVNLEFDLPDNITSWRMTSIAISDKLDAGNVKENVIATKPFFVMPVMSPIILDGDTLSIGMRGLGNEISTEDMAEYEVTIEGENTSYTEKISSGVREYATINFSGLAKGEYSVTVSGKCNEFNDVVKTPLSIVSSGIETRATKTFKIGDKINIDTLRYPVTLCIYDKEFLTYNRVLSKLYSSTSGGSAAQRLGYAYSYERMKKMGNNSITLNQSPIKLDDIDGSKYLSPYPDKDSSLELTVLSHMVVPDIVNTNALINEELHAKEKYMGNNDLLLELSKSIVNGDVTKKALDNFLGNKDLSFKDNIYLALAYYYSGHIKSAQKIYSDIVLSNIKKENTSEYKDLRYVQISNEDKNVTTALASYLASVLKADEAEDFIVFLYYSERQSYFINSTMYALQYIYYLENFVPEKDTTSKFSYILNGEKNEEEVDFFYHLDMNKEQLEKADFKNISGDLYVDVYYTSAPDDKFVSQNNTLDIKKTFENVNGSNEIVSGDIVKVTLEINDLGLTDKSTSLLVINDYIPSGFRYERYDDSNNLYYYPIRQGQRIDIFAWRILGQYKKAVYYVRAVSPGDYVLESTYISSSSNDITSKTERDTITIKESSDNTKSVILKSGVINSQEKAFETKKLNLSKLGSKKNVKLNDTVYYDSEDFFQSIFKPQMYEFTKPPKALILPHHLVASDMISGALRASKNAGGNYDTIIILSTSHFKDNHKEKFVLSDASWITPFGVKNVDKNIINVISSELSGCVEINSKAVEQDHGVAGLIPYLQYYYPNSEVVAGVISNEMDLKSVDKLSEVMKTIMNDKNILFVSSIDFSHYLMPEEAVIKDNETKKLFKEKNYNSIKTLTDKNLDSKSLARLFLKLSDNMDLNLLEEDNSSSSEKLPHGINSSIFSEGVTTYFVYSLS